MSEPKLCPDCKKEVKDGKKGLSCDICQNWFHVGKSKTYTCQKVPDIVYRAIEEGDTDQLHWYCSHCNLGASSVLKMVSQVRTEMIGKIDEVNRTLIRNKREQDNKLANINKDLNVRDKDYEKRFKKLEDGEQTGQVVVLEQKLAKLTQKVDGFTATGGSKATAGRSHVDNEKVIDNKMKEMREEEIRRNNIIIHNVPESEDTESKNRADDARQLVEILRICNCSMT